MPAAMKVTRGSPVQMRRRDDTAKKEAGKHLAEKGIDYAKSQLGMGMAEEMAQEGHGHFQYSAMMSGAGHDMDGDGIGHWLKQSGKEVAKHVGKHLLKEFGKQTTYSSLRGYKL